MKHISFLFVVVTIFSFIVSAQYAHASAPICNGQTATVYVDSGIIVGGPNNGTPYTGTLTANTASVIVGTSGDDTIIGSGLSDTICAGDGNDTIDGGTGTDKIAFSTNSDTTGITISATGSNSGNLTTATGTSTFTRTESFVGTSYDDTFVFGTSGSLTGTVDGADGADTADYSARTSAVSLNMITKVFTSVAGAVTNIENAIGGAGADTIIGNSSTNTLTGNSGNDIIFGQDGADTINGGAGRDILIGGTGADTLVADSSSTGDIMIADETSYSNNSTVNTSALSAIRTEWALTSTSYANRVAHIQGTLAGGLNGTYQLKASTLQADSDPDSLDGNSSSVKNWYILNTALDSLVNSFAGETITNI